MEIRKLQPSPRDANEPAHYLQPAGISGDGKSIKVDGFSGAEIILPDKAGLSFVNEDEVWAVIAKGIDAPSLLHNVASRVKISNSGRNLNYRKIQNNFCQNELTWTAKAIAKICKSSEDAGELHWLQAAPACKENE